MRQNNATELLHFPKIPYSIGFQCSNTAQQSTRIYICLPTPLQTVHCDSLSRSIGSLSQSIGSTVFLLFSSWITTLLISSYLTAVSTYSTEGSAKRRRVRTSGSRSTAARCLYRTSHTPTALRMDTCLICLLLFLSSEKYEIVYSGKLLTLMIQIEIESQIWTRLIH